MIRNTYLFLTLFTGHVTWGRMCRVLHGF